MYTIQTASSDFLKHCRFEKNLSNKTIKSYNIDLNQLSRFFAERNYPGEIEKITRTELREFLESISILKPKSIKRKVATIKAMFNFLEFEDRIPSNPLRKMRISIKEDKKLPRVMNMHEIRKIFNVAYTHNNIVLRSGSFREFESLRNTVVIELLFATGARVSELSDLTVDHIDTTTGDITIKGKGNKERFIQVCNFETLKILKDYQKLFKIRIENSGGFFLVNRLGKKLTDQSIRIIVRNIALRAKIQQKITPHVFRHTFATLLLEKDVDLKYIQSFLGHSSIMTTQIYTHVNREKQKKILRMKHPRRDFSMLPSLAS